MPKQIGSGTFLSTKCFAPNASRAILLKLSPKVLQNPVSGVLNELIPVDAPGLEIRKFCREVENLKSGGGYYVFFEPYDGKLVEKAKQRGRKRKVMPHDGSDGTSQSSMLDQEKKPRRLPNI